MAQSKIDISHISDVSMKHWLNVRDLPHSAQNGKELHSLLERLVDTGKLRRDVLIDGIREIEENGSKTISLYTAKKPYPFSDKSTFSQHLKSLGLTLDAAPEASIKLPKIPTVNYICWSSVRIKFSETQTERTANYETQEFEQKKVTKFVVIIAEPETGFVQIRYDPPAKVHMHKDANKESSASLYEMFYFNKAKELLGVDDLTRFDLTNVADRLVNTTPPIIRLPREVVITSVGGRQTYSSRVDVRSDPARSGARAADGAAWVYEDLAAYWIPGSSNGALQRELYMRLKRRTGTITFWADCLANEVDYALSRIRAVSGAIS